MLDSILCNAEEGGALKVCVDIQPALGQRAGVGRYTRSLVERLGREKGSDSISLFYFDFMRQGLSFTVENVEERSVRWCPGRLMQKSWSALNFPPFDLLAGRADVYHFPNFIIPPLRRGRSIVTIHDVSFLAYPQFTENRNLEWITSHIHDTVRRADSIITDSSFSAREIVERLAANHAKVFPIHLGLSDHFKPAGQEAVDRARHVFGLDRPYLLTVGTIEPRKNLEFLIAAFEQMSDFDGYLALAGMRGWKCSSIFERIKSSSRASDICYIEYVSEADLSALYSGAELFMFPSLYEGFGLPPLEAMACGTPVIASSAGSLPEVLGKAALLIPVNDHEAWAAETARLLDDRGLRRAMSEHGRNHASHYNWSTTAKKTWEVYRQTHHEYRH